MSNSLLSSYSSCFVFTKHSVQLETVTTNDMFSKYVLFKKGHLNKRAGVWTPWTPPWIRPSTGQEEIRHNQTFLLHGPCQTPSSINYMECWHFSRSVIMTVDKISYSSCSANCTAYFRITVHVFPPSTTVARKFLPVMDKSRTWASLRRLVVRTCHIWNSVSWKRFTSLFSPCGKRYKCRNYCVAPSKMGWLWPNFVKTAAPFSLRYCLWTSTVAYIPPLPCPHLTTHRWHNTPFSPVCKRVLSMTAI